MTKTNRIISVLLSVILAFSTLPLLAYANAIPEKTETLDKLIQSDSIANLVEWLLKSLDKRKDKVTGTVLRYVLFALKDEDVKKAVGEKDALKLSDEEAAKILVNFLNAYLPKVTESFTGEDWWPIVQNIAKGIGLTVDLSSVDGAIKTLRSLCELVKGILDFGDAEGLNGSALKDVSVGKSGNLGVIKALIKWLADNTDIVKRVLTKGESLSLGIVDNVAGGTGAKVGKKLQEAISPEAIKKALYKGIKLDETEYESSAYKNFSADELLAAKFVQLMAGNTEKVAKDDAQKVLKYTIYDFFTKYANQAYAKFLIPELEKPKVKEAFKKINMHNTFNLDYKFDDDTFSDLITSGMEGGFVEQFNNVVYRILETILTPETLAKLDLKEGGNENLDENFAKVLRYILPLINESGVDIGYDFSQFTEESVKTMETEEMAVAVLKIFYPGWFHFGPDDAFKTAVTQKADSLEKLLVLAVYFAIGEDKWIPYMSNEKFTNEIFVGEDFRLLPEKRFIYIAFDMAIELGARALDHDKKTTRFALPANTKDWTTNDYIDEIVDWALEMIKGLPAVSDKLSAQRNKRDGYGGFYKLNVLLNELLDFSFVSGCDNGTFKFDIEHMLVEKFLPSLCNFDVQTAMGILEKNQKANVFNKKLVPAVIDMLNRLLTAIFEYVPGKTSTTAISVQTSCTSSYKITKYDAKNGLYINAKEEAVKDGHDFELVSETPATCQKKGERVSICTRCGEKHNEPIGKSKHTWGKNIEHVDATCTEPGKDIYTCTVCGYQDIKEIPALGHHYVDGVCTRCNAVEQERLLGDIDLDDDVTAADARLALRAAVKLEELTELEKQIADVDKDGDITAADARLILRVAVGLEVLEA